MTTPYQEGYEQWENPHQASFPSTRRFSCHYCPARKVEVR